MRWSWKRGPDRFPESPVRPLYEKGQLESDVAELRRMLAQDASADVQAQLRGDLGGAIAAFGDAWFQRIDFPGHSLTTTSDHRWAHVDEGGLNTLGGRLTGEEASILRPWPKWTYLRRILPDLRGKTALEIGSANGFFCFRFAERGAQAVTGVEANARLHDSAVWAAEARGCRNVRFIHGDALLDLTLPGHDVVFLSEAWNHFLSPAFGLLRILALARETVVLDTGIHDSPGQSLQLKTEWRLDGKGVAYHTYVMSEGLLLDLLRLMGVEPARVQRYRTPRDRYHAVYVIDTRDLAESRSRIDYPEYLRTALDLRFKTVGPSSSDV
jgi:SAM-dependent methyltransferase